MAKNPAFQFYAQDFIVDTFQWDRPSKSLHVDLLCIAWINGHVEADSSGMPIGLSREDMSLWNHRVKHKWQLVDGKLYNLKQEEGREKREKFLEAQSEKGKKSAIKKAEVSKKKPTKVPTKVPTEVQPKVNRKSTSTPVEPGINHLNTEYRIQNTEKEIEIVNENEKTAVAPVDYWKKWVEAWFEFYQDRNGGIKPSFNGAQAAALKRIKTHLAEVSRTQHADRDPEEGAFASWMHILNKWGELDKWLQTQFDLTVINKKINDIINQMKNGTPKNNRNGAAAEINAPRAFAKIDLLFAPASNRGES